MWLSPGDEREFIHLLYKNKTSDARYGAMLLYFKRNLERGDMDAIKMVIDRLPNDIRVVNTENSITLAKNA